MLIYIPEWLIVLAVMALILVPILLVVIIMRKVRECQFTPDAGRFGRFVVVLSFVTSIVGGSAAIASVIGHAVLLTVLPQAVAPGTTGLGISWACAIFGSILWMAGRLGFSALLVTPGRPNNSAAA